MGGKITEKATMRLFASAAGYIVRLTDKGLGAVGAISGFGGLFAGAACCVLPLALASTGIGASGVAFLGPLHTPLSAVALLALIVGWYLHLKRRRACTLDAKCDPPARDTTIILSLATAFVLASAILPFTEAPLMGMFEK